MGSFRPFLFVVLESIGFAHNFTLARRCSLSDAY
jgi:hypothetical protein